MGRGGGETSRGGLGDFLSAGLFAVNAPNVDLSDAYSQNALSLTRSLRKKRFLTY
jgi:hypothetical protein